MGRIVTIAALIALASPATVGAADQSGGPPPPAPPKTASSASIEDVPHPPLVFAGWTYSSIIRNGATANINLARGRKIPNEDAVTWRGLQFAGTVGSRGFEVGAGYARYTISMIPLGWEVRGLGGRRWDESDTLSPAKTWVGGEMAVMLLSLRFAGGLVVPMDPGQSRQPVLTGSVGVLLPLMGFTKAERERGRARRGKQKGT